jgi:hypothetical protein
MVFFSWLLTQFIYRPGVVITGKVKKYKKCNVKNVKIKFLIVLFMEKFVQNVTVEARMLSCLPDPLLDTLSVKAILVWRKCELNVLF